MSEGRQNRTAQLVLALSGFLPLVLGAVLLFLPETQENIFLQIGAGIFLAIGAIDLLVLLVMRFSR